jgi:hypothetical protein
MAGRDGRGSLVTGPVDWPPVAFAAPDRSTGASLLRLRSHPFDVRWPRRAVRGCRPPDHPASAFSATLVAPKPLSSHRPCGFSRRVASRLRARSDRTLRSARRSRSPVAPVGDAARAGHSCLVFFGQCTFRARTRAVLAAWPVSAFRFTGDVRGICSSPFAVLIRPSRVSAPSSACVALAPTCRLTVAVRREFHRSRDPAVTPGHWAVRLRLLGFGPAGQPWPRDRRSRYSFCA